MPITDPFETHNRSMTSPVTDAEAITPQDTADLTHLTRALYVGGTGDVRVDMADGTTTTFLNMPTGWHPVRVSKVWQTGTTATGLVGCW